MDESCELAVVRHGETPWNREHKLQGHADPRLSALGLRQAKAVAERLAGERFTAVISSDLQRAHETALAIGSQTGLPVRLEPQLRERNLGLFQGHTWEEVKLLFPAEGEAYHRDPDFAPPGGGESRRQMFGRVWACVTRIAAENPGQRIVIVTHGGPLEAIFKQTVGLDANAPRRFGLANAAVNVIGMADGQWKLHVWGDVRHLAGLEALEEDGDG